MFIYITFFLKINFYFGNGSAHYLKLYCKEYLPVNKPIVCILSDFFFSIYYRLLTLLWHCSELIIPAEVN